MAKAKAKLTTHAVVTLEVKVRVGSWGPDCTVQQVYQQAAESAEGRFRRFMGHDMELIGAKTIRIFTDAEVQNG